MLGGVDAMLGVGGYSSAWRSMRCVSLSRVKDCPSLAGLDAQHERQHVSEAFRNGAHRGWPALPLLALERTRLRHACVSAPFDLTIPAGLAGMRQCALEAPTFGICLSASWLEAV